MGMHNATATSTHKQAFEAAQAARSDAFVGIFKAVARFFAPTSSEKKFEGKIAPVTSAC